MSRISETFRNALDNANIDHEKKMIIEGHFGGTRAKHYTDRELDDLRDSYQKAYSFINLGLDHTIQLQAHNASFLQRLVQVEIRLERQSALEAKLTVLEDKLDQMQQLSKKIENAGGVGSAQSLVVSESS